MIAEANQRFEVGTVYIGEPLQHLVLADTGFGALVDDPTRLFGNRTVDFRFRWVAEHSEASHADCGRNPLAAGGGHGDRRQSVRRP